MNWDLLALSTKWNAWLHHQMSAPNAMDFQRCLPELLIQTQWLSESSQDIGAVCFEQETGLVPLYPDISLMDDTPQLLTPAYVIAKLWLSMPIPRPKPSPLLKWLHDAEITFQMLLLSPIEWRALGISVSDIPEQIMALLAEDDRLQEFYFSHWAGDLPFLAQTTEQSEVDAQADLEMALRLEHETQGISKSICAKRYFLKAGRLSVLKAFEAETIATWGIDLGSLPIPLDSVENIHSYWDQAKQYSDVFQHKECALMAINALMVLVFQERDLDLSAFEFIDDPYQGLAVSYLIDRDPSLLRKASSRQKSSQLRKDLGL